MNHFFTILRDSFREAVDGFVIYVMLAFATLAIIIVGTITFRPEPASEVIPSHLKGFQVFLPDKGRSQYIAMNPGVKLQANDIQQNGSDVRFQLAVESDENGFRKTVAAWVKPETRKEKPKLNAAQFDRDDMSVNESLDLLKSITVPVSEDEAKAVTDEQMSAFLENQFYTHIGISNSQIKRAESAAPGKLLFDVQLRNATSSRGWSNKMGLFFGSVNLGATPLGIGLLIIEEYIINGIGAGITLIISVVVTGFFIPNLLRKGSLDLIVAKPIGRVSLLICKYLGGCLFIFLLTSYSIGGIWLVLGLQSGHWDPRLLLTIPMTTFAFALLYAFSTIVAVFTRSPIAAILLTIGFAFSLYVVGKAKQLSELHKDDPSWSQKVHQVIDVVNMILPRYKDIDTVTSKLVSPRYYTPMWAQIQSTIIDFPSWYGTIGLSMLYIVIFIGLASWRMVTRDG